MHFLAESVAVSSHCRNVRRWQVGDLFIREFVGQGQQLGDEELDEAYVEKVAINILRNGL